MRIRSLIIGTFVVASLSACYEEPKVTIHEPGVYKGSKDQLMQGNVDDRTLTLQKRFTLGQTDR